MLKRVSKSEFLKEFKDEIVKWVKYTQEEILASMQKYNEDSVRERNDLKQAIRLSRPRPNFKSSLG